MSREGYHTGILGKKVPGVIGSSMKPKFFALSPTGQLSYYSDKKAYDAKAKPENETPWDLRQCVIKFDLSKAASSKKHPISIVPKNRQGGDKELDLEANSVDVRDVWRNAIRATLAIKPPPARRPSAANAPASPESVAAARASPAAATQTMRTPMSAAERRAALAADAAEEEPQRPSPRAAAAEPPPPPAAAETTGVTAREARTEVGALLKECRLEEYTHAIVTVERFELVSDLRGLTPELFDAMAGRVGLKLGQSRKLKKRLGLAVDTANAKIGVGLSSLASAAEHVEDGAGGLGIKAPPPPPETKEQTASEKEAWELVRKLRDEITVLQVQGETGKTALDFMEGWTADSKPEMATGKLLTSFIPVVVSDGPVSIATIAADAGEEDNAVRRVKFEGQDLGLDIKIANFGEPLTVGLIDPGGEAAKNGVEVGDLLIDANGQAIPTDRTEQELRRIFAGFKRPVTLGFYKLRKATEQARRASLDVNAVAALATAQSAAGGGGGDQPQTLKVDGCPDGDCNGTYSIQPHKVVNGFARYLKNHSFYYIYRMTTGHWMITWFEPDIDEDKGEYRSEIVINTPAIPSRWVGGTTGTEYPGMVVFQP